MRKWVEGSGFAAAPGDVLLIAGRDGKPARALGGLKGDGGSDDLWAAAALAVKLPLGSYRLDPEPEAADATRLALGWSLGAYSFTLLSQGGSRAGGAGVAEGGGSRRGRAHGARRGVGARPGQHAGRGYGARRARRRRDRHGEADGR